MMWRIIIKFIVIIAGAIVVTVLKEVTEIGKVLRVLPVWKQILLGVSYMVWGGLIFTV